MQVSACFCCAFVCIGVCLCIVSKSMSSKPVSTDSLCHQALPVMSPANGQWFSLTFSLFPGDSTTTACAIAREAGILSPTDYPLVGLPDDLQHLSATKSTWESTYSSTDTLHSQDLGDADDRTTSGSRASTSASASQDGASAALSTPVKAVLQAAPGHTNNGAGARCSLS